MAREDREPRRAGHYFRIWVSGRLDERFSEGLAGVEQEDVPPGTVLHGEMLDRSQLNSMLDLLRNLGIDVLRFEVDVPPNRQYESPCSAAINRTSEGAGPEA